MVIPVRFEQGLDFILSPLTYEKKKCLLKDVCYPLPAEDFKPSVDHLNTTA